MTPWKSAPQSLRKRKKVVVTLSDEARARLEHLADAAGESKSAVVEDLVLGADEPPSGG